MVAGRDSESRRSMGPPQSTKGLGEQRREPNPQTDYKRHFNKTKERFDVVNADQTSRKKELDRASLKQLKLQEELEYLLDSIAGEQLHARQLHQLIQERHSLSMDQYSQQDISFQSRSDVAEPEYITSFPKRQRPSPTDTEDELLEIAGAATKRFREE